MGSLQNQLTMAWNNLAMEFRIYIPKPTDSTILRNFIEQIDAQADMWMELAVPRSLPQGKQPLLLESGEGSPSRPTQKPSTNQRMSEDEEDDQEMAPNPDGYYMEDLDLDYYNPSH